MPLKALSLKSYGEAGPNGITLMFNGLKVTLVVTLFAVFLGVVLGTDYSPYEDVPEKGVLNLTARAYTELIRGTPRSGSAADYLFCCFSIL